MCTIMCTFHTSSKVRNYQLFFFSICFVTELRVSRSPQWQNESSGELIWWDAWRWGAGQSSSPSMSRSSSWTNKNSSRRFRCVLGTPMNNHKKILPTLWGLLFYKISQNKFKCPAFKPECVLHHILSLCHHPHYTCTHNLLIAILLVHCSVMINVLPGRLIS